ncbi:MAG: T9SS type A sorting domain-containing protein [Bacteroidota bacterium]
MKTSIPIYSNTLLEEPATSGILVTLYWTVGTVAGNDHINPKRDKNNIFYLSTPYDRENRLPSLFLPCKLGLGYSNRPYPQLSNVPLIGYVDICINFPWSTETSLDLNNFVPTRLVPDDVSPPTAVGDMSAIQCGQAVENLHSSELSVWLTGFTVIKQGQNIKLSWVTSFELDNEGFGVERSIDILNWQKIGFVEGREFTIDTQHYSFIDESPISGLSYYRLKQTDSEGVANYSKIVAILTNKNSIGFTLTPNPKPSGAAILIESYHSGRGELVIYSLKGRCIRKERFFMDGFLIRTSLDLSDLHTGIYLLEIREGTQRWQKLIVAKNG